MLLCRCWRADIRFDYRAPLNVTQSSQKSCRPIPSVTKNYLSTRKHADVSFIRDITLICLRLREQANHPGSRYKEFPTHSTGEEQHPLTQQQLQQNRRTVLRGGLGGGIAPLLIRMSGRRRPDVQKQTTSPQMGRYRRTRNKNGDSFSGQRPQCGSGLPQPGRFSLQTASHDTTSIIPQTSGKIPPVFVSVSRQPDCS